MKNKLEYDVDPELNEEDPEHGTGDEGAYDGEAVSFIQYVPSEFEFPDNYEFKGDDE